jgi:hypothetical protein
MLEGKETATFRISAVPATDSGRAVDKVKQKNAIRKVSDGIAREGFLLLLTP